MLSRKSFGALFLFMLCASVRYAQTPSSTPQRETGFLRRSVTLRLTTIDYRVYIPADYDPAKKYPVILYLHGRGARGNDNEKQIGGAHLGSVIQLFDMKHPGRYRSFLMREAAVRRAMHYATDVIGDTWPTGPLDGRAWQPNCQQRAAVLSGCP